MKRDAEANVEAVSRDGTSARTPQASSPKHRSEPDSIALPGSERTPKPIEVAFDQSSKRPAARAGNPVASPLPASIAARPTSDQTKALVAAPVPQPTPSPPAAASRASASMAGSEPLPDVAQADRHAAADVKLDQDDAGLATPSRDADGGGHLTIKVGLATSVAENTAINYAVTNNEKHALSLLIVRCNALNASGAASGQAFDALHNLKAGETAYGQALFLKQTIPPKSTFACRDEGTAQ